ncbi:MAG: VCBS repeat-containing protein [Planctomycetota bacterium]
MPRRLARIFTGCAFALAGSLTAQLHVSPLGSDAGAGTAGDPFQTINHAAAVAAPGTRILLQAGVYGDEQGIVTLGAKDLVLVGAGPGATILRPHSTATVSLVPAVVGAAVATPHRVGVLVSGSHRLHLSGLTIDAQQQAPASGHVVGVYVRGGADVVADRLDVRGVRAATLGVGQGQAIAVRGDVAIDPSTLVLTRSTLRDFERCGVHALLRAELDLQQCVVVGAGATAPLDQCGVLAEASAALQARGVTAVDLAGANGCGLRLEDHAAGCLLEGNRVARVATGIALRHTPPAIVPGDLRNNRVASVATALRIDGVAGLFVERNQLSTVSRFDPAPFADDTAGDNAWIGNRYAIADGTPQVAIPGGGNVDSQPRAGIAEFGDLERVACAGAPIAVIAADLDGDGHRDFATLDLLPAGAALTIGRWTPGGYSIAATPFGGPDTRPVELVAGEFNGAPGLDLVALTAPVPPAITGGAFRVFANDGFGGFVLLHHEALPAFVLPTAMAAGNFNGDAATDLVVLDAGAPPLTAGGGRLFVNAFGGVSWASSALPIAFTAAPTALASGDLDGDGFRDLVVSEAVNGGGKVHGLLGDGVGGLSAAPGFPLVVAEGPRGVALADLDGDGDLDLAVACDDGPLPLQHGALQLFVNQAGALQPRAPVETERGPTRVVVADFDADGFYDGAGREVLVLHEAAWDLSLFGSWSASTGFVDGGLCTAVDGPADAALTMLDGDLYTDLIVAEPARGGVALLRGAPSARFATLGEGCPGTGGIAPRLEPRGDPGLAVQPNPTLEFGLSEGFPMSVAALAIALQPGPVLVPCGYLLDVPVFLFAAPIDAAGRTGFVLPLPPLPDARGLTICAQAGVYDFAGAASFLDDFSLTAALCFRVGR